MKAARKVEEIEKNLLRVEEIYSRYETMTKERLPEDIKTVIMTELCTPEFRHGVEGTIAATLDPGAREGATVASWCFAGSVVLEYNVTILAGAASAFRSIHPLEC